MQVDFQDFLSTGLIQVVSTTCSKSANIKMCQAVFHRLNGATREQVGSVPTFLSVRANKFA